ncbi:MAG TPA: hypothetical protein VJ852_03735 [Gemmatimonadaceae bacterium]|nr:hypothetical protein [Gemmatimonadaceae bacterium]
MDAVRDADSTIRIAIRESAPALHKDSADKRPSDHFLHGNPTLATVIYKGRSRSINPIRVSLLRDWGLSFLRDSTLSADFHREYLFQEGDSLFWLPVQDRVAAYFPKELRAGQQVNLYVILIAGEYLDGKITWAFIVNEFNTKPIAKTF